MLVVTGPEYRAAAPERSRLGAADSDREQAIGALQAAFTQGRLTKDELVARVGRALAARTYAELDALTADTSDAATPASSPAPSVPAIAGTARPSAPAHPWPMTKAAVKSGGCLAIAAVAWIAEHADTNPAGPGPHTFHSLPIPMAFLALIAIVTAFVILGRGIAAARRQRRSRRRLHRSAGMECG
ncbi:MAG TPA: DUF1707 domain-containing protein [Trebonia sp.]